MSKVTLIQVSSFIQEDTTGEEQCYVKVAGNLYLTASIWMFFRMSTFRWDRWEFLKTQLSPDVNIMETKKYLRWKEKHAQGSIHV